ncbi:uncharacterized protein LOC114737077 [Neltuma alba]|uniref:uncharacterized protein LOC114737077 n=1 Tax=Neltuma alba TaxID=207710 RepID=UPI0010A37DAC|nr:uncharacterized protein LOC114737077 [Prosopis alba]
MRLINNATSIHDICIVQRLVKAARDGDVNKLHNVLKEDFQILEKTCLVYFAESPLHVAALSGKTDFVNHIVARMPSLATETNQQGHLETVRDLLKAKLDDDGVNQCLLKDDEDWTALHRASQKGKSRVMAQELISKCPQCREQVTTKGEANRFEAVKLPAERIKRLPNFLTQLKA